MLKIGICLLMILGLIYICNTPKIEPQQSIDKALYCIHYSNAHNKIKYKDGNCYQANANINAKINEYYKKQIF